MLPGPLGTLFDLLLVVLGFGLIVFIHELGHFLAARWAKIRVLAFAVGFGPAIFSYRKGMGLQRGSSEATYREHISSRGKPPAGASPTEYRLNALPLGGYVKMLGQEDLDPGAVSEAPDSYQNCTPWKRLIVISAGVLFNILSAAVLFMIVFGLGLRTEPPVIGPVIPGSPADTVVSADGAHTGLRAGDEVLSIDGEAPRSFNDITLAAAMGKRGVPVAMAVRRAGVPDPIQFELTPEASVLTGGLQDFGFLPSRTVRVFDARNDRERADMIAQFDGVGLAGLEPGMQLVAIDGREGITHAGEIAPIVQASRGEPMAFTFEADDGRRIEIERTPVPLLDTALTELNNDSRMVTEHLLGLMPLLRVDPNGASEPRQGLEPGDVFVRIGTLTFPSVPAGITELRAHAGRAIEVEVERQSDDGPPRRVTLNLEVSRDGLVGFTRGETAGTSARVALPPDTLRDASDDAEPITPAATRLIDRPGVTIESVGGEAVDTLFDVRRELRRATRDAYDAGAQEATVAMVVRAPNTAESAGLNWTLTRSELDRLHGLGWRSPITTGLFEPEQILLRADGPVEAVALGAAETKRVMLMTYLTFARLFEGTVKVEHLKGPVGIAHVGTLIASRGFVWLLFFLALVSVNLAVINFLPLPIVDGGQFLMIVYEMLVGRPVPMAVQGVVTTAGLILIAGLFLFVTFNDVRTLLGL